MKKNTFFEKTAAPEPIHLMTEVTSILDSICKKGTRVKITKIYYNRKKLLVGVEYKGKFGWLIGGKIPKIRLNPLFKNLAFGG